jgi:hypothetical protein
MCAYGCEHASIHDYTQYMTAYIRDPQDIHAIYARAVSVILQDSAAACMSYSHYDYYYYYYYYYYIVLPLLLRRRSIGSPMS